MMNGATRANATVGLEQRQREIVAEFAAIEGWEDRYRRIIEVGRALPAFPEEHRTDRNRVKGCQSQVWLHAWLEEGRVQLLGDSDAAIVRGLVALVLRLYSDATPEQILATQPTFIDEVGLSRNLTASRSNGLLAMVKQIRLSALVFQRMLAQRPSE